MWKIDRGVSGAVKGHIEYVHDGRFSFSPLPIFDNTSVRQKVADTFSVSYNLVDGYNMGLPQDSDVPDMDDTKVTRPFPAPTRQVAGEVNGVKTDVMSMSFADKIMITITQNGRLAQWVCFLPYLGRIPIQRRSMLTQPQVTVPLHSDNPTHTDPYFQTLRSDDDALLPSARFQPRTLLGAGGSDRETLGQLYASQIATAIATKTPDESRSLMLGLGLAKADIDRDVFLQIIDLVLRVL